MISPRISSIPLVALAGCFCLSSGLHQARAEEENAQKKPQQADKQAPQKAEPVTKAVSDRVTWPELSPEASKRIQNLSPAAREKLKSSIAISLANVEAALAHAVKEDEAAKLSAGGVPSSVFQVSEATKRTAMRPGTGPSAADRKRFLELSDETKSKLREEMTSNRERLMAMSAEERRSFVKQVLEKMEQADKTPPKKKAVQDNQASLPKKKIIQDSTVPQPKKKVPLEEPAPLPKKKKIIITDPAPQPEAKTDTFKSDLFKSEAVKKPDSESAPASPKTE